MDAQQSDATLLDQEPCTESFLDEVLHGLQQSPKTLPCKYFYDQRGSQLPSLERRLTSLLTN